MKVSFVWMWPYRILDARAQKECSWRVVHVLLQMSWLAGALCIIIAALATSRASTQTPFVKFVTAFSSLLSCVVCWWNNVWAPFPERRTTSSLRSLGRENCLAVTTRSTPQQVGKALSFASFIPAKAEVDWLCFKEILALGERESERFSPWQSENYYLWRDLRATECPTDKNGESQGMRLSHVFEDRPRIACVHACVPSKLVGKCCALLTKSLLWHCICSTFFVCCL